MAAERRVHIQSSKNLAANSSRAGTIPGTANSSRAHSIHTLQVLPFARGPSGEVQKAPKVQKDPFIGLLYLGR